MITENNGKEKHLQERKIYKGEEVESLYNTTQKYLILYIDFKNYSSSVERIESKYSTVVLMPIEIYITHAQISSA